MPKVTNELYEQRVEDWAKLAKLKCDKWLLKRAISLCGSNQLAEVIVQIEETLSFKRSKDESRLKASFKMHELHKLFSRDLDEAC